MEKITFSTDEVFRAYKKLKHYFYYDNTSLFIRDKIADFESQIEQIAASSKLSYKEVFWKRMSKLAQDLDRKSIRQWKIYFKNEISYLVTPKSIYKKRIRVLTNRSDQEKLHVERINIFIDASIEVHIIAVLWLMRAGKHLASWVDSDNYAYQLELGEDEKENVVGGLRLYKPYFIQYQNWRDKAIKKAEELFDEKKDAVILSLDIKDYFHSIKLDIRSLETELYEAKPYLAKDANINRLFELLHLINDAYTAKIKLIKKIPDLAKGESVLPIGLLSSGLLGNLYLREFDRTVKEKLNPNYYGRYVDDILFVIANVKVDHDALSPINSFLDKYFVDRGILSIVTEEKEDNSEFIKIHTSIVNDCELCTSRYIEPDTSHLNDCDLNCKLSQSEKLKFKLTTNPSLIVQSKKVILQDIDHKESPAILNNFKKNLEKNRSEFRYLPDEDEVEKEFDEEAFSLHYNDSLNKLRSIKEFTEDKYGASKYLAGKIFATSLSYEKTDKKTTTQILTFFKGDIGIKFHTLWEKVATYFIINEDSDALTKFYTQCKNSIDKLTLEKYEDKEYVTAVSERLKTNLREYLRIAICTPLAFNPSFAKKGYFEKVVPTVEDLIEQAKAIRKANMFRHAWVGLPGVNFTVYLFKNEATTNLLKITGDFEQKETNTRYKKFPPAFGKLNNLDDFVMDDRLSFLAPRYVHFHEINILEIYLTVNGVDKIEDSVVAKFDNLPTTAFRKYWHINQAWKYYTTGVSQQFIEESQKDYFEIIPATPDPAGKSGKGIFVDVKNNSDNSIVNKKIALANIKVDGKNIKQSYLGYPNTSRERRQTLFNLVNLVEEAKCDLFVLPEVSVPYQWISLLAFLSQRRNVGIIAGLEHWVNKYNFAFNFMVTILPIKRHKYTTCLVKIRLKNHYSHEEIKQLEGYRLFIPSKSFEKSLKHYDLFHWKKAYFSVYNCFELADISDRAIFKSQVDFIIASEYNRDVRYFSEVAGSWVRDIHCFFIQVNSSDYGDSRVIQPSSSVTKDILQIKGGENDTIIVGELPISNLRDYQLKEYTLQQEDSNFKPTPPDFSKENVLLRLKNKKFTEYGI